MCTDAESGPVGWPTENGHRPIGRCRMSDRQPVCIHCISVYICCLFLSNFQQFCVMFMHCAILYVWQSPFAFAVAQCQLESC